MTIYERLQKDHETQKNLAEKIMKTSGDTDTRQRLFEEFKTEVESHAAAEEQIFYAALMETPEGQEQARHSVAEHEEAANLLEELTELHMGSGGWIHKFEKLKKELVHHIEEEEREVFPLAKSVFEDGQSEGMATAFDRRKSAES